MRLVKPLGGEVAFLTAPLCDVTNKSASELQFTLAYDFAIAVVSTMPPELTGIVAESAAGAVEPPIVHEDATERETENARELMLEMVPLKRMLKNWASIESL